MRLKERLQEAFSLDARSLALFRIALAALVLADLCRRAFALSAHYTDAGVLPRAALGSWLWTPYMWNGQPWYAGILFAATAVAGIMMLVGWRARPASLFALLMTYSLHYRNPLLLDHSDHLLRALLLWSVFLPLDRRIALDRHGRRHPDSVYSSGSIALVLQAVLLYASTAILKIQSVPWRDGTAVPMALGYDAFATRIGSFLLNWPALTHFATYFALAAEFMIPLLLLGPIRRGPARTAGVFLLLYFHLMLQLCLDIGLFQYAAMALGLALLPSWFWDRLNPRAPAWAKPLTIPSDHESHVPFENSSRALTASCILLMTLVVFANIRSTFHLPIPLRPAGRWFYGILLLDQDWNMFSDPRQGHSGWFHLIAAQKGGAQAADLTGAPQTPRQTVPFSSRFVSGTWRNYWSRVTQPKHERFLSSLQSYACGQSLTPRALGFINPDNTPPLPAGSLSELWLVLINDSLLADGSPPTRFTRRIVNCPAN